MKLTAFKAFIPRKPLVAVALVLGLAVLWYLQVADKQTDHIVRRNFNHLNQIAANIETVQAGLRANVLFECDSVLGRLPPVDETALTDPERIHEELRKFYAQWADESVLVKGPASIQLAMDRPTWTVKAESFGQRSCAGKRRSFEITAAQTGLTAGGLESHFILRISERQSDMELFLSITQDFDLVRGLDFSEGYFDTILIGTYSNNGSRVYYNTAVATGAVPEEDIRALFNATHDYARFGSLEAFEQATRISDLRLQDLAGARSGSSGDDGLGASWSSHSRLLRIPLGSDEKLAFSQPLTLTFMESSTPVIIGLMDESEFNRLKYRLPLNVVLLLVVLLLAGILSFSLLRLKLLPKHAVIRRYDIVLAGLSTIGLALLATVLLSNTMASWSFSNQYREDLERIHGKILNDFYAEREEKLRYLQKIVDKEPAGERVAGETHEQSARGLKHELSANHGHFDSSGEGGFEALEAGRCRTSGENKISISAKAKEPFASTGGADKASTHELSVWTRQCFTKDMPIFTDLFLLDRDARQVGSFVTFDSYDLKPGFAVASRRYYQALVDDRAWRTNIDGVAPSYYMERIETLSDGALETAISLEIPDVASFCGANKDCSAVEPEILVGTTQFHTLDYTAMPPGYGFAVFDRLSGDVLYHSNSRRSRRENFYRATDDAPQLKAAVISGLSEAAMDLSYKGDEISATLSPLRGTDWALVTFYDRGLVDVVNFRFSAAIFGLSGLVLMFIPVAVAIPLCLFLLLRGVFFLRAGERLEMRRYPVWVYPRARRPEVHRMVTLYYAFLLWLYVGVMFCLDLSPGWLWLLYVLLVSPVLWYLLRARPWPPRVPRGTPGDEAGDGQSGRASGAFRSLLRDLAAIARGATPFAKSFLTLTTASLVLMYFFSPEGTRGEFPFVLLVALCIGAAGLVLLWLQHMSTAGGGRQQGPSRSSAFDYASLSWYRLQLCMLLLLVVVIPGLQLHNDSYDVHERLWWDFHSWAVSDRLVARNRALQSYADSLNRAPTFDLDQLASGASTRTDGDSRGLYLPRTSLNEAPGAEPDPERMTLTITTEVTEAPSGSHAHGTLRQRRHAPNQLENRIDNWWVADAAQRSPAFSTVGAVLREFIDVDQHLRRYRPEVGKQEFDEEESEGSWMAWLRQAWSALVEGDENEPAGGKLYFADQLDERRGIHFQFDYYFPHTRAHPRAVVFFYFLLILSSAALILLLLAFVMRRSLLCRELELAPRWPEGPLAASGRPLGLLVPAHLGPGAALEAVTARLRRETISSVDGPTPLPGGRLLKFDPMKVLVLTDFIDAITDGSDSRATITQIERALDDGYTAIVLSDVHPAYWLKHRMCAESMADEEFLRWESFLRRLDVYRYTEGRAAEPVAVNYRRAWEHSSVDERLVLGAIYYEGLIHTRNRHTLQSLVNRGLLRAKDHHLEFEETIMDRNGDYNWGQFLHDNLPRGEFVRQARAYQTDLWKAFRGPLLLALFALLGFLAYVAQDELRGLLSLLAALGAAGAALTGVGERLRTFRDFLAGGGEPGG